MVDPVSFGAGAAVLIATKALEKTGEKLSESTWNLVSQFLASLKRKDPSTATAIERVTQQPILAKQEPENFGTGFLVSKVEKLAQNDPEIKKLAEALAYELQSKSGSTYYNFCKLVEKGVVNQGIIYEQKINIT